MIKRKIALICVSLAVCLTFSSCSLLEMGMDLIEDIIKKNAAESFIKDIEGIGPESDNEATQAEYDIAKNGHSALPKESYYGYSFLEGNEKEAYDRIDEAAYKLQTTVVLNDLELNDEQINKVYTHYIYDNPQVFWLYDEYTFLYSNTSLPADAIALLYTDGETTDEVDLDNFELSSEASRNKISEQISEVSDVVSEVLKSIPSSESDKNKAKMAQEYICSNAFYDYETSDKISEYNSKLNAGEDAERNYSINASTIYGCLVKELAVCSGISEAYQFLLYSMGIENLACFGMSEGEHHQWNIVSIDDKYYHVDVTWDVSENENEDTQIAYFNYLFMSDEMVKDSHASEVYKNEITEYKYGYDYPQCTDDSLYFSDDLSMTVNRQMSSSAFSSCLDTALKNKVKYVEVCYGSISERELPAMVGEWIYVLENQNVLRSVGSRYGVTVRLRDTYIYNLNSKVVYLLLDY